MEPQKHSAPTKVRKFLPLRFAGLSFKIPWLLGPRHTVWKLLMSHWTHVLLLYWDNDTETYQAVPPSTWNQTAAFLRLAGLIPPEQVGVGKPDDSPPPGATPRFLRWDCVLLSIKILVGEWLIVSDSSAFKVHLITPFPYSSATAHRFLCRSTICGSFILLIYALGGCPLQPFPNCPCQEVWDNFLFSITVFSAPIIIVGTQ